MSPLACCIRLVMYWTDVSKKFAHTKEEFKILFARECQAFLQHHWTSLVCQLRRAATKVRHHPGWEQHQASSIEETSVSVSNSSFVTGKLHLSGLELQVMGGKKQRLKMMSEEVNSINHSDALFIDENMKEIPSSFPGSSSVKLTHDFYHVDSDNSDDVYTNLMRS